MEKNGKGEWSANTFYATDGVLKKTLDQNSLVSSDGIFKLDMAQREEAIYNKTKEGMEIRKECEGWALEPINSFIMIKPFNDNPFNQSTITKSGIILPEVNKTYTSQETGEVMRADPYTKVARVIEVNPSTKFVHKNDIVFYRVNSAVPLPYFRDGYEVVAETSILAILTPKNDK